MTGLAPTDRVLVRPVYLASHFGVVSRYPPAPYGGKRSAVPDRRFHQPGADGKRLPRY